MKKQTRRFPVAAKIEDDLIYGCSALIDNF